MNKIIVIGCPGSGKSKFSIKLAKILKYPVLHLDEIYHIDNHNNIGREELISKTIDFAKSSDKWIIDGNYKGTIDLRIDLCDAIILFNIDTETCIKNVSNRAENGRIAMAENFDASVLDDGFIDFINEFKDRHYPIIYDKAFKSKKELIILDDYSQVDTLLKKIEKRLDE